MVLNTIKKVINYAGHFFDKRLEDRGEKIVNKMIENETAVLNQLSDNRAEFVGACRFFNNDSVTEEAIIKESAQRCQNAVAGQHVLALQDTTEINHQKHRSKLSTQDQKLGPVGNNKDIGFFIHPVLVLEQDNGFPLGIADVHVWNRDWDKKNKHERNDQSQPIEDKESYRWIQCSLTCKHILSQAIRVTIVSDREGDIYEEFARIPDEKTDLVIRSLHDRKLYGSDKKLFEHLSQLESMGTYELEIKKGQKKRTPRLAKMEVRYDKVKIARPAHLDQTNSPEYIELYAIEARECAETIPEGEEGVLWRILTTHEIHDLSKALEVIYWYSLRWRIEELFRTLKKKGFNVEDSQLETGAGLRKLVLMALNAALIVMQLVGDRDGKAGKPGNLVFNEDELECLKEVSKKYEGKTELSKNPHETYSLAWTAWIIGRMGGWKGYRRAGPAGPITMKRGLQKFSIFFEGWIFRKALENP